ncbi:cytosine deaminase [Megamonas funiformis]|uniref:Cytosine deaminase n=1 Tax=Megamonas funiformis TaxID=437897 RepID=A0AAW4U1J9_9FIRM|nr:cytosine deaminase [Megamonas funiformis]MBD9297317.1 cytosine deaminase [Megamonas funiformis]MCB6827552.1 cytosine deaminase [Megamonas funiformis]
MKKKFINVKLKGKSTLVQILTDNNIIVEISPFIETPSTIPEIDLKGFLVSPPYVEPHIHLDYVFTAQKDNFQNKTATLFEGIQCWSEAKSSLTISEIKSRALKALKQQILYGVQYVRTHIDITDPNFTALKALLEIKEELKNIVTIQIVAFPQEGIYSYKNGDKLLEEALKMGADCVGGIPHYELAREIGEKSIHKIVELATKYNKLIDVHCDETDDSQSRFLELLNALVYLEGIGKYTTASHTCSFGSADNSYAFRLMQQLKKSNINFVSCPTENIYLQGRQDTYPKRRGLTRVKELYCAGINVCFAQDSILDPWYPLGNGNLMNILDHGIHISQLMTTNDINNALDLITINGAKALNIDDSYGIKCGNNANFIVLDAKNEFDAICNRASVIASIRNGDFLFEKEPAKIKQQINFLN